MNIIVVGVILWALSLTSWWFSFNAYCLYRFNYCHSIQPSNECGVYFIDRWEYPIQDRIIDFLLSFVRCEGVTN